MKFERVLFKMSFTETFILSLFFFAILNGFVFLFSILTGKPGFLLYDTAWILQIVYPIIYSVIQTSINRNGVLKINDYNDLPSLIQKIESLILRKGYIPVHPKTINLKTAKSNTTDIAYVRKTKWSRFFNYFFRENISIQIKKDEVLIFTKRNLLIQILTGLKYDKSNNKLHQAV